MTSIDPSHRLFAVLRPRIAAAREQAAARTGTAAPAAAWGTQGTAGSATAQRLQALAADDPDRAQKAVRIYLESELTREFGTALLTDPSFPGMLDAVQEQMTQDPQTAAAVQALGDLLVRGAA